MTYLSKFTKARTAYLEAAKKLADKQNEPYVVFTYQGKLHVEALSYIYSPAGRRRFKTDSLQLERVNPEVEYTKPRRRDVAQSD